MDSSLPAPVSRRTKSARALLFLASLSFFGLLALYAAEWALNQKREKIRLSDHLDPDLVHYDADLGWTLTCDWKGAHSHHDFQARYSVNSRGFRNDTSSTPKPGARQYAFFGDSFTFGLGVNDDQTFVHLLDAKSSSASFVNCGVPGFSTDQEMLLMEKVLPQIHADETLLAVYLPNDLFDNQLPSPLQVRGSKPFFVLQDGTLQLRNSPVPAVQADNASKPTLASMVFGSEAQTGLLRSFVGRFETLSAIQDWAPFRNNQIPSFSQRFVPALDLFWALVHRTQSIAESNGSHLSLVILAGRSFVEDPNASSSQFQEALRLGILTRAHETVRIIDVATAMQTQYVTNRQSWFFPNDGHLNPLGHQIAADTLSRALIVEKR